jgi:two-component system, NarL family, sensor histidine kinase BarA
VFIPQRLRNTLLAPIQFPSATDLDHATQKWLFYAFAGFAIGALALYTAVFWMRGARAQACETLVAGLLVAAGGGVCSRARSFAWPLRALSVPLFLWLTWTTIRQGGELPSAAWWLSVVPFILAGAGMHYLAIAAVFAFVGTVTTLYLHPAWIPLPDVRAVEPWRKFVAVIGSEFLALWLIIIAMRSRARVAQALETARSAASEAADLKARFLANMSHEIRTPLTGIIGAAEVLDAKGLSDAQRVQLLSMQRQSARTLLALVNDVLDFAKLDAGKVRLEHQPVFLRGIVFESNELYSMQAFAKGIEISSSCNPDVPQSFLGDQLRLRQVVNNLVSNAVKFTERGGVHIHLSMDPRDDHVSANHPGRWMRIEVVDSGPGISEDQQKTLFNAFVQADPSVTRRFGGTGLGLSIAQELCRLMGGRIEVQSVPGEGSRFSVLVPLTQNSEEVSLPVASHRADVLLATANSGLGRHLKTLLNELRVDPVIVDRLPDESDLTECRMLIVDAPLLSMPDVGGWISTQSRAGRRIAILTPLGADAVVGMPALGHILYKPVRRKSLEAFVGQQGCVRAGEGSPEVAPEKPLAGVHVLVAEDNPVNQVVVQAMLAELGATSVVACNGREAIECIAGEPFDVALMDVNMPEMDGLSATRALRALETRSGAPRLRLLATTATLDSGELEACLVAGMDACLTKPFGLADLRRALESVMRKEHALSNAHPSAQL